MKREFLRFLLILGVLMLPVAAQENSSAKTGAKHGSQAAKPAAKTMSKDAAEVQDKTAAIKEALTAASPEIAKTAKVLDWDGNVLKEGSGAYTCYPTPSSRKKIGKSPMCLDKTWQAWADAWLNHKDFKADQVGIAYMLEGDVGASNTDPYAQGRTADNQWVVSGPHTMVLVPDPNQLKGLSTDPDNGGPFVMWKGTPYAHIMVPVGKHQSGGSHMGSMDMGSRPKSD
jgi:hypothetical protein